MYVRENNKINLNKRIDGLILACSDDKWAIQTLQWRKSEE